MSNDWHNPDGVPGEMISPEGVEEKIKGDYGFRVTLTGGGKYRVYTMDNARVMTIGVYETLEEAKKTLGQYMMMGGIMLTDPKQAADMIIKNLTGRKPPP